MSKKAPLPENEQPHIVKVELAKLVDGSRADGRPEGYALPTLATPSYMCSMCAIWAGFKKTTVPHYNGDDGIVMMNPADTIDGNKHMLCKEHQPDDIVIFNPATNMCHDKKGENSWSESNGAVELKSDKTPEGE